MKRQGLEDEDLSDKMRLDKLLGAARRGHEKRNQSDGARGARDGGRRAAKDAGMQVCSETDDIRWTAGRCITRPSAT